MGEAARGLSRRGLWFGEAMAAGVGRKPKALRSSNFLRAVQWPSPGATLRSAAIAFALNGKEFSM